MVTIIKQTWWHIEEIYFPSNARKIRHVMDLFTDETIIPLELDDNFVGLRVVTRNSSNREIAFLENNIINKKGSIVLNLDNLESFPEAPKNHTSDKDLKHVKLEIEYILTNPKIKNLENNIFDKIRNVIIPKKYATIEISGWIQPEFYITLQPGWRIGKEGHSVGMEYYIHDAENENKQNGIIIANPSKSKLHKIKLEQPFIKKNRDRQTYNYLIHHDSYSELNKLAEKNISSKISFEFTYVSQMSRTVAGISMVPFIVFLPISTIILLCGYWSITHKTPFVFDSNFGMAYLIVSLSFSFFYLGLIKEDFFIPHKNWHFYIFAFTLIIIFSIVLKNVPLFRTLIGLIFP